MKRPARIALISAACVAGLAIVAVIAVFFIAQSDWLREKLRTTIVEQAEKATGGRVEVGAFHLDWRTLTADVDGFVIHGTEPGGQSPLLAVDRVTIGFRIISVFTRDIRLDHVDVTHPKAHIIIGADGQTNLPRPKTPGKGNTVDMILNLKIGRFAVHSGEALVESPGAPPRTLPWSAAGQNLAALATYDSARDRYAGNVSLAPLHLTLEGYGPLDVNLQATAAMERDRVTVSQAKVTTAGSEVNLSNLTVGSFAAPVAVANYQARVSAAEAVRVLHWKTRISGMIDIGGKARYISPRDFDVNGAFRGAGLAFEKVRNIRLSGNLAGTQAKMTLANIKLNLLGGYAAGNVDLDDYELFHVRGNIKGLDVQQLVALNTPKPIPYDGLVSGTVEANGRLRDLSRTLGDATAQLTIAPAAKGAPVHGEISASYHGMTAKGTPERLDLGHSWLQLPATRLDVTGTLGSNLAVTFNTTDLNDITPALSGRTLPFTLKNGAAIFTGTVTGAMANPLIVGHLAVTNAIYSNRLIDSAGADVRVSMSQANIANAVLTGSGITASGAGSVALADWATSDASAINAAVQANNLDIAHVLDLTGEKNIPATGVVTLSARISGTLGQPTGNADLVFRQGLIYQQPYDSVTTHLQYVNAGSQNLTGVFVSGPKRVDFNVNYSHAGLPMPTGTMRISATSNSMALNQIALVRQRQPDIEGAAQFHGTAGLRISRDAKNTLRFDLTDLDGDGAVTGIALAGRDLGDAHFTARTQGSVVTANFDSNAAKAMIQGQAKIELTGQQRTTGSVTFSNASLNSLAAVIATPAQAKSFTFDGAVQGKVDFDGPLFAPRQMTASATLQQVEVHPLPGTPLATTIPHFSLHNSGPVKVSLAASVIQVDSARFTAPETDMSLNGTAALTGVSPLNLVVGGTINLAIIRNLVPDLASSGVLTVRGTVRGNWSVPDLSGVASIRGGEFHYADFSNSLTNADVQIVFSGTRATIQSFTADTGGGKFSASGFATFGVGSVSFQLSAKTRDVRVRYPQGVSSISDSDMQLVRNSQRSAISGTVTVRRLVINPQQDASAILADVSANSRTPATSESGFAGMNLDVQIVTAPDVALQSKVAQSIQADANLRLRGTVGNPALLGRINISQGEVIFFGNKYTISQGAVSFFNPTKIEPILNVDLETKARGVEVTLTVSGPLSKLGMTYRSDPPLEFSDIVALLATGRTPDDPSVALRGNAPTQSFEQLGASALIGQAIADPVAGRLQRFFGVSRLKIDPQLSGATGSPGARLTVEQQVTPDILFTYITDVSNTSQQLIRVEWAFNPKWSAILERGEDGYVGLDFAYKKRFK